MFAGENFFYCLVDTLVLLAVAVGVGEDACGGYVDVGLEVYFQGFGQKKPGHAAVDDIVFRVIAQGDKNAVNLFINTGVGIGAAVEFEGVHPVFAGQLTLNITCGNILKAGAFAEDS